MNRFHWLGLCFGLLLIGLVVIALPGVAAAAPDGAPQAGYQDDPEGLDPNDRNLISVPGVLTLRLGRSSSTRDGALRFDGTQVDLPAINATATVDGFAFSPRSGSFSWDAITLAQMGPRESEALTISDTQVRVQGASSNFSTDFSTRIDVRPGEGNQAGATIAVSYDGMTGQPSLAVADGNAQVAAGPATLTVQGLNAGDGTVALDSAQVMLPEADTGLRVDGFTMIDGNASWEALAWYGREFNLGDVVTLSDSLVVVPGPGAANAAAGGATTTVEINVGDAVRTGGQLVYAADPATGQPALSVRNGSAVLGVAGWNLAVNGINTGLAGASIDTVTVSAEPLNLQAQVSGIEVAEDSGASFDQARILYLPEATGETSAVAGFELVITSTDAGYVVTTTTLVPTARAARP